MKLKIIRSKKITLQDIETIQCLDEYKLTEKAYMDYISTIKCCGNLDYDIAKKKIIRNIILSEEAHTNKYDKEKRLFYYGCLSIGVNEIEKSIYFIKNYLNTDYHFKLDIEKRKTLNYVMEIREDKY